MEHASVVGRARELAAQLASAAAPNDREARFPREAVAALGSAGLLGLNVPREHGGLALGPRTFAEVTTALAEADASLAMVYVMHVCGAAVIAAAPHSPRVGATLREIAGGRHLTTLAFSEKGSRSHFWVPVSRAQRAAGGVTVSALKSWVTSAGHAQSYVVSSLAPEAAGPTDSTLYLVPAGSPGLTVSGAWTGMGLRANGSAPMALESVEVPSDLRLTGDGQGMKGMLEIVLPLFSIGSAAMGLGLCRAAVAATIAHLKSSRFEHLDQSLGEALPTLRQLVASMQIDADGLAARLADAIAQLEQPGPETMLRVLELKAAAGDTAIAVTSAAMRAGGGAAYSAHNALERYFRDAHASAVMAPTGDVLREFIARALLGMPLF